MKWLCYKLFVALKNNRGMGDHNINTESTTQERLRFIKHLLDDIEALQILVNEQKIESGITRIGAEQEFCLVKNSWAPAENAVAILSAINDSHFTTELAKFNLEINLDPIELTTDAFTKLEEQLTNLLEQANKVSAEFDTNIVLTGILPTISKQALGIDYMTPNPRYYGLNDRIMALRGTHFRLHLTGVEDLSIKHDSIMFEACNTSFQMHLQIDPSDFISSYNWAQAIAGPVLGLAVNSPLLLGRELWSETRIALFQQSIDTRGVSQAISDQQSRVTFGERWAEGSIVELFKNEIARYKIIITKDIEERSLDALKYGRAPKLQALNLHNGTIYRWNRPCYGVGGGKAHLRIENRYIPAGPTIIDEMANFAFWVGLMVGRPKAFDNVAQSMDFKDAKLNFIKAARNGSESVMKWMGKDMTVNELVLTKLLPIARKGLEKAKINQQDIDKYLGVIEGRAQGQTGAQWITCNYRQLRRRMKKNEALLQLIKALHKNQKTNQPVHLWKNDVEVLETNENAQIIDHIMSTKLLTVFENDSAELTLRIMKWRNIHHLPIVDLNDRLVGLLTWRHLAYLNDSGEKAIEATPVSDIMVKAITTTHPTTKIQDAIALMKKNNFGCLPVIEKEKLVGIVTVNNILAFDHA
jgi:CBS domain-containing protein